MIFNYFSKHHLNLNLFNEGIYTFNVKITFVKFDIIILYNYKTIYNQSDLNLIAQHFKGTEID